VNANKRDFLTLADYGREELLLMLDLASTLKESWRKGRPEPRLAGKVLACVFHKPSLRTRLSFEVGMRQLGGQSLYITDAEIGFGKRESIYDIGQVISRYVDGVMIRTFSQENVEKLAAAAPAPVINGLTHQVHPCQVFSDLLTIKEKGSDLDQIKVAYLGDGNNLVHSWLNAALSLHFDFSFGGPEGYHPQPEIAERARERAQGKIVLTTDPEEAIRGAQVVYTDTWTSMGQEAETEKRMKIFPRYQVNQTLLKLAAPNAIVMHCLPAHRGQEITDAVMDGPQSVVFDQAENRLHGQKAILVHCLNPREKR
jgi:ornithine carbamoyltransferase